MRSGYARLTGLVARKFGARQHIIEAIFCIDAAFSQADIGRVADRAAIERERCLVYRRMQSLGKLQRFDAGGAGQDDGKFFTAEASNDVAALGDAVNHADEQCQ